jgi:plasmid maintenance system antidote protein VapI
MAPEQCPHAKLTWETVKTMRQLYSEGATQDELAAAFPVSQTNIGRMIRNEQWTVSDPTWTVRPHYGHSGRKGEDCSQAKLTQKQVDTIRERYVNGESQAALARQFGVCASTISFIILNQTWVTDTPIKSRGPTFYRAEENGNTKLTWELVYKIRELYPQGYTLKELAALTDIKSSSSIWRVVHNKVFFDSSYTPPPKIPRAETWKRRIRYRG